MQLQVEPGGGGGGEMVSRGYGFHRKDAACSIPSGYPPAPHKNVKNNDNALQEVAATAHCVWLCYVPSTPP